MQARPSPRDTDEPGAEQLGRDRDGSHEPDAAEQGACPRGEPDEVGPLDPSHAQLLLGQRQHGREQEQRRQGRQHALVQVVVLDPGGQVARAEDPRELDEDAQRDRTDEGARQRLQTAHHRRREGVEDHQGQRDVLEADLRGEHDARQPGQPAADRPGQHAEAFRARPVQREQGAVVDDGPHAGAGACPTEQQVQADGDRASQRQRQQVVVGHEDAPQLEAAPVEERRDVAGDPTRPDRLGQAQQQDEQADGDGQGHGHRGVGQVSHHRALEQGAEQGCEDQDDEDRGHAERQPPRHGQLPEHERTDHADGAVRHVEDVGRRVGDHQARRRDREGGRRDQPEDGAVAQQGQEVEHQARSPIVIPSRGRRDTGSRRRPRRGRTGLPRCRG